MPEWVVDTNVWAVADGLHDAASLDCQATCVAFIEQLSGEGRIAWDTTELIRQQYADNTRPSGLSERVLRQLLQEGRIDWAVAEEFLPGEEMEPLDPSDHIFLQVALWFQPPRPIVNAVDTDWYQNNALLERLGVTVLELCQGDLQQFSA